MNITGKLILISLLFFSCSSRNFNPRNFNFENWIDNTPTDWTITSDKYGELHKDSNEVSSGHYSIRIKKSPSLSRYVYKVSQAIAVPENTGEIIFTAKLKGREIKNGYAGIFYTVLTATGEVLSYEDFTNTSIQGTTDWETLTTTIKIIGEQAQRIQFGTWFLGSGELWVDDIQLENETGTLGNTALVPLREFQAIEKELISRSSEAIPPKLNDIQIDNISRYIQYWGFLKYYDQSVSEKDINMDSLFYENLPAILNSSETDQFYAIIIKLFEAIGTIPPDSEIDTLQPDESLMKAELHDLTSRDQPRELIENIRKIELTRQYNLKQKYIEYDKVGRIKIINEPLYNNDPYPDKSVRLLALARYWNIINFFYPYRYHISGDWKSTLQEFIPRMLTAGTDLEYVKEFLVLMARLNDGHADIVNYNAGYDSLIGSYRIPIRGLFVKERLIVQECLSDAESIQPGDQIYKIDGQLVDTLITRQLEIISGSNKPAKLHNMIGNRGPLLRSHQEFSKLSIERNGKIIEVVIKNRSVMEPGAQIKNSLKTPAYEILKDSIGYINTSTIKDEYFPAIKNALEKTTSIIIDLRCYPSIFLPFGNYANWLIPNRQEFALVTKPATTRPGAFYYTPPQITGYAETFNPQVTAPYKGKVYILVDINSISQAEHAAMAFGIGNRAIVVGEQTAGANGDVIRFWLPGNIQIMISGVGIYYPDGKEVQRAGVKVDIPVEYTIEAIANGKDAILEKTIEMIVTGFAILNSP